MTFITTFKTKYLFLFFVLASFKTIAQNGIITGTVKDGTGAALEGDLFTASFFKYKI
jgi:hypothetical protein